jgi:hypothetical protein
MDSHVIEIGAADLGRRSRPLAQDLADGKVAVLRDVPALKFFREELIRSAADAHRSSAAVGELTDFYESGRPPEIELLHSLVAAIKAARDERYLSECLAPVVRQMGFEAPILVDGGINRLVLPPAVVGKTREFADLFAPTDYKRETADGPTETFMPGPSNIHRDFDRDHYLLMCNIWAPLHDAGEDEIVHIYPRCYRQNVHSMPNTPENRQSLGRPVGVSLKFGDCLVFHGEQMHHSPDPSKGKGRRHSYDFRIAAACPDDNRHYRYNFVNLENYRSGADALPSLIGYRTGVADMRRHHREFGKSLSANYYWRCLERQPASLERVHAAHEAYSSYPFSEDRYLALARLAAPFDAHLAGKILKAVVQETRLYFFALKCAEDALEYGQSEASLKACERALELLPSTAALKRFAPVAYEVPGNQLMPAEARQRAEALRAATTMATADAPGGEAHAGLVGRLRRFLRRAA